MHKGAQLVCTAKYTATIKAVFNEVKKHEGFCIQSSDMLFVLDVDVGNDGFSGILLLACWPVACTSKV